MAFDAERLLSWDFEEKAQSYDARDAILYALGVGLPLAPGESDDLNFLLEDRLRVLPSFAVVLATPGMWPKIPELEIDWVKVLHMAHAVRFDTPLPTQANVRSRAEIKELYDRGPDKGSVCILRRQVIDADTGTVYCTIDQTVAMRGNGGFGGDPMPRTERPEMPGRAPDHAEAVRTSDRAALIYRLSGDLNPLHADYDVARSAGFDKPILHGLANYGTACAVVLRAFCDGDPKRMKSLNLRFAGIVLPGDQLDFTCWKDGSQVLFEARVGDRVVIDQGVSLID
ncbi:MaoC like domain protein [Marinovum algicola]|uniref:Acyl dehydratase n=1 Tax=Marinovum algicola TaxID=42444 RepID=A0A975ZPC0_9RHOB|nr:MaoC/PaaZ C-terminal domain-containing protein [Marinovum algicola]SEJ83432.1 Acyl dehydratase [Marinovum algicola]SLN62296.1 MaoC like domain protein [Marinovum algicola]